MADAPWVCHFQTSLCQVQTEGESAFTNRTGCDWDGESDCSDRAG